MNIISQNFINVLKNRLESKIKNITSSFIDILIKDLIGENINNNRYLNLISDANSLSIDIAKTVIIDVIKEFDNVYRNSNERRNKYYINKSNVPRTITTIIGEITFTRTYYENKNDNSYYFYIDDMLNLPKYDKYDPIVKGLSIRETFYTNQAQAGRIIGERITNVSQLTNKDINVFAIPRQSVNNWLKDWNTNITYDKNDNTPKTLYIMVDEKYIGCQDLEGDIMGKAFVIFEGIKEVSKERRALINRHIFTCYSKKPWEELLDRLTEIYDYNEIESFYVLSDGGNWITAGMSELKLEDFQNVEHLLCLFHFKQAINHITTITEERKEIFNSFLNDKKGEFKNNLNNYIEKYPNKKNTIEKKIQYLLNHYDACKHMIDSSIGSSMESHISHFIASTFASRPKGYSVNNINKYFMLNDARINGVNLFNTYLQTYNNIEETLQYKEDTNCEQVPKEQEVQPTGTIPYLKSSESTPLYSALSNLTKINNEIKFI